MIAHLPYTRLISAVGLFLVVTFHAPCRAQDQVKRGRGEGYFRALSSNTTGPGNIWLSGTATGFIWDDDPEAGGAPAPFAFPDLSVDIGILRFLSVHGSLRPVWYRWNFGWLTAGLRATLPNNKGLRLHGLGLNITYHNNIDPELTSIAGYRTGGTGFCPEGFIVNGHNLVVHLMHDLDLIAWQSSLPFKITSNLGMRIPLDPEFTPYSQYLATIGIGYIGVAFEFFCEYSLEAFINSSTDPKTFSFNWNWGGRKKKWEVAFWENPMYLTIGGKIRYENGVVLYGAVPLLVSMNWGSGMTGKDKDLFSTADADPDNPFYDEVRRGITDPFDPWYAQWKIIGKIMFPLRFRQTGAEMMRTFLSMKNVKRKKKIDIDHRLRILEDGEPGTEETDESEDDRRRLDEIRRRRRAIEQKE